MQDCNKLLAMNYISITKDIRLLHSSTRLTAPGHREDDCSRGGSSGVTETQDSDTSELNRPVLTNATLAPSLLAAAVALTLTPKLKKYC